jgi:hypothetical protein
MPFNDINIFDRFSRRKPLTKQQLWLARCIAMTADAVQLFLFPLFAEGFISPFDDALDLGMSLLLSWLVGWHWAFAPSIVIKLVPFADEAPTWTLAVLIATYNRQILPPPPVTLSAQIIKISELPAKNYLPPPPNPPKLS